MKKALGILAAAALATVGVVSVPSAAMAADLGTLTLSQESGTVSAIPMLASVTTSAACPVGYGTNAAVKVGRAGTFSNLAPIGSANNYADAAFSLSPNRSMARALTGSDTGTVAAGDWDIVVLCAGEILGDHADMFRTTITVTGNNWVKKTAPVAQDTVTTLSTSPASPVVSGTAVTLTAAVAATTGTPAGSVEFFRGVTSLGSAPVAAGSASITKSDLPVGSFNLTAKFTATNSASFKPSTSAPVAFQVTAPAGAITAEQEITADIAPGAFTLTVAGGTVVLTGGTVGGSATGALNTATVVDLRGSTAGWVLTGQVEDFTGAGTISGNNLGWAPSASKVSGSGSVTAGSAAAPGATTGLGTARTLCSAVPNASAGTFTCGAGLTLVIPDNVAPGGYAATLTLTLV